MTVFSVRQCGGKTIAHALDFDIVAIGSDTDEAIRQLRSAVKHHVEFGLRKQLCDEDIRLRAPEEHWRRIKNAPVRIGEAIHIEVDGKSLEIIPNTTDETEPSFTAA
jgi:hypothetical protein